ncbi:MAG TPA: NAD(P)-dependent oxidoreductase, partial [Ktedonobacterales bacterium]|nr:NAD(P)-dependent oxidoreductase [Ktedonobacterales bacterium]
GAIGKYLVPRLVAEGDEVVAMSRSSRHSDALRAAGAAPVVADALDRAAVLRAVTDAQPEVVIHELTALTGATNLKHFDDVFAMTNRLRTEGTDNLLAAARAAGVRRFVAQSYGNWIYARTGPQNKPKTEEDALDPNPPRSQQHSLAAIRHLEDVVLHAKADGIEGVALRYGNLYGPATSTAADGAMVAAMRKRMLPIIGDGAGVWSFLHVEDAAAATVAAITRGVPGIYNVCDDEPAPARIWLPALAQAVGAPSPLRVPVWLGRLLAGEALVSMMTQMRGASNAKAKRELGWTPHYATWRVGFKTGLG